MEYEIRAMLNVNPDEESLKHYLKIVSENHISVWPQRDESVILFGYSDSRDSFERMKKSLEKSKVMSKIISVV